MFARHTIEAITALASVDATATDAEREALGRVLAGEAGGASRPLSYADAAEAIGVSVVTVKRLALGGTLCRVFGTGRRAVGVTAESVERLARGEGGINGVRSAYA